MPPAPFATSHQTFHSFCVKPGVTFESQAQGEEVILLLRAHPITQLPWILNTFFLLILLGFINVIAASFTSLTAGQFLFLNVAGLVFTASYAWFNFLTWFFNVGIITNHRIIDIDFHYVIYKEVTATGLDKIEDVTAKSGGYFESLFNYGDVFIQTAGTNVNIEFLKVPRPAEAVKIINEFIEP